MGDTLYICHLGTNYPPAPPKTNDLVFSFGVLLSPIPICSLPIHYTLLHKSF